MEVINGHKKWGFQGNPELNASSISVSGVLTKLMANRNKDDKRPTIPLGRADPTEFPSYRTTPVAPDAVADATYSYNFNCYPPTVGVAEARRAVAEYLSKDFPYQLSPDDVYLTAGCTQAIEIVVSVLARPNANILFPRPGYPQYEARASCSKLEARHYDLIPEKGWEVDLDSVEALADENTVAMVIINPSNPCGNVFTYQHLKEIAETASRLGIFLISDEVYGHLAFGSNPFVPMGVFGSTVPVLTLGSIAKRWIVPGWRLGWIVTSDPNGIFHQSGVKLNLPLLEGIIDDVDFCMKLAKEESVIVLPGVTVGLKNCLRITFAVEHSALEDGLGRIKAFYHRHAKMK
ncbi:hypothetical protein SO802_015769 [Lithocarpus litseifolius]|uniref:Aminotransferase class I/classII large domain-containing protein n=1 Tax=Lithocarpus litseifolius TaxID=425828 RepID=A0AAW2CWZ8_9ROSI